MGGYQPTDIIREFVTLFVVIDPIGTIPVFIYATQGIPSDKHWRVAIRAVVTAALVLFFFLVAGQILLEGIGLSFASFQIAGGIVLFLFAMTMIFGESKPQQETSEPIDHRQAAVFPLAMPSIASPGAILAVVVLTDNTRYSIAEQALTATLLTIVLAIVLVLLLFAGVLNRILGTSGASIISRVMGLILAAVAVDAVLDAMVTLGVPLDLGPAHAQELQ